MKKLFLSLSLLLAASVYAQQQQKFHPQALIELYSSEGCESCPFADRFMKEVLIIADSVKQPVYVIDFHVDIWDRSGWKDPYSDSLFSQRQSLAAKRVGQQAIFTPMVFVNGQGALPGAAKREVGSYINNALGEVMLHRLTTSAQLFQGKKTLSIDYEIQGNTDSVDIHFAFVQKHVLSKVTAGDNAGHTLEHHNVVRKFATEVVKAPKGHYELALPADATDLTQYALVSYLQHQGGGYVYAVDELLFR